MNEYKTYERIGSGQFLSNQETVFLENLMNDLQALFNHAAENPLPILATQEYQNWVIELDHNGDPNFSTQINGNSQTGLGGPLYEFLHSKTVDANDNRLDNFNIKDANGHNILDSQGNPISNGVSDWLNGAKEVNANSNFQGGFIQHYTNFQYALRIEDNEINASAKGQQASNLIALNVANDIIFNDGEFPDIKTLGVIDAGAAASTVFNGDYAPWAGTLLFPYLGVSDFFNDWLLPEDTSTIVGGEVANVGDTGTSSVTFKSQTGIYDLFSSIAAATYASTTAATTNFSNLLEAVQNAFGVTNVPFPDQSNIIDTVNQYAWDYYGVQENEITGMNAGEALVFNGGESFFPSLDYGVYSINEVYISVNNSTWGESYDVVNLGSGNNHGNIESLDPAVLTSKLLIDGDVGIDSFSYEHQTNDPTETVDIKIILETLPQGHYTHRYIVDRKDGLDEVNGGNTFNHLLYGFEEIGMGYGNDIFKGENYTGRLDLSGGLGEDIIIASDGHNTIYGDYDNDFLAAGHFGSELDQNNISLQSEYYGGEGRDVLIGYQKTNTIGENHLYGDEGNDVLIGGPGANLLNGGVGHDFFFNKDGLTRMIGGEDADLFYIEGGEDRISTIEDFSSVDELDIDVYSLFGDGTEGGDEIFHFLNSFQGSPYQLEEGESYGDPNTPDIAYTGNLVTDLQNLPVNMASPSQKVLETVGDDLVFNFRTGGSLTVKNTTIAQLNTALSNDRFSLNFYELDDYTNEPWAQFTIDGQDPLSIAENIIGQTGAFTPLDTSIAPTIETQITSASEPSIVTNRNDIVYGLQSGHTISLNDGDDIASGQSYASGETEFQTWNSNSTLTLKMYGEEGNDTLTGGLGNSQLYGGFGNDTLTIVHSIGKAEGGDGDDFISVYRPSEATDTPTQDASALELKGGNGQDVLSSRDYAATLYGEFGNDNLTGSQFNDILYGGDDTDFLTGGIGADTLDGGNGEDTLFGGAGDDNLNGSSENDTLYGGNGNDALAGGSGNDLLYGGYGSDVFEGNQGIDTASYSNATTSIILNFLTNTHTGEALGDTFTSIEIFEGSNVATASDPGTFDDTLTADNTGMHIKGAGGNDQIFGGTGTDELHGDDGDDYIEGKGGADVLYGGIGNDTLDAKLNGDNTGATLYGGEGDDILQGSTGSDMLYGGSGNDDIDGSTGSDEIYGGDDNDDIDAQGSNDLIYAGNGDDDINMGSGNDTAYGGAGNDVFTGYSGNNEFYGGAGTDTFNGGTDTDIVNFSLDEAAVLVDITQGSLDTDGTTVLEAFTSIEAVVGSTFDDDITGDVSNNTLSGHDGNDILTGQSGNDVLNGDAGNDTLEGGNDDDLLYGGDGDDTLYGGAGTDDLYGGSGNDELFGESGNDNMYGGSGNDILHGNVWVDYLFGGNDNDILEGGSSNDELTGGLGADSFIFNQGDGHDTIFDFSAAQSDVLTLDQGAFTSGTTLSDIAASAYINGSGHLRIDIDTGGSITLEGVTSISVNELEWI